MSRILILGGYGGFGSRLTKRLASRGHRVLVAGRNARRAAAFCKTVVGAEPVVADRNGNLDEIVSRYYPDLLIDAAGPFQNSGYQVPLACARSAVPYLDLADARDFVTGIRSLDQVALAGGVAIVSGASSVPALSGAAVRHLASGLDRVWLVEIAISASSRAATGASVATAILSCVGKPVRLWRGRRWSKAWGWQDLRRMNFRASGVRPLNRRWVALGDVPDHQLLPELIAGRPAVIFRAGTESRLHMLTLWLLSWPVRWGWLSSLRPLAPLLLMLRRLTTRSGTGRSAMSVKIKGTRGETPIERSWTLIACNDDGPEVPTLAATILTESILAGETEPGARDASALIALPQFDSLFRCLNIRHETAETVLEPPLYERVMGPAFLALPAKVRELHRIVGDSGASGEAEVMRGQGLAARLVGWVMSFPPRGRYPVHVAFAEADGAERWIRSFGPHSFSSTLCEQDGKLVEQFGPLRFYFDLPADEQGLRMEMRRWSCFNLMLPFALAPRSEAKEWVQDGRFWFDVRIGLPLVGFVVRYRGWLASNG